MSIVRAENIKKRYIQGKVEVDALRGVSANIDQGEFVAMAGPSGSGKTTILNIIGGIDNPDSGKVVVDGNNYSDMTQSKLAELRLNKIGFVFQAYNLIPVLSAEENVEYIMLLQGVSAKERKKKARAILDDVGLEGIYSRRPSELSGWQQQRVAVARAIVSNPAPCIRASLFLYPSAINTLPLIHTQFAAYVSSSGTQIRLNPLNSSCPSSSLLTTSIPSWR